MPETTLPATPAAPLARSFGGAVRQLRDAQKSNRGAAGYSRWVNRPLGRVLAAAAFTLGLTPNAVTALSAVATFSGIAVIALVPPSVVAGIGAAALLVLGYALDSADGQLARLTRTGSVTGEWLDHVVDSVKIASIHLAVLISWARFVDLPDERFLLAPIAFAIEANVFFFTIILTEQMRRAAGGPSSQVAAGGAAPVGRSLLVLPTDYGLLCLVVALSGASMVFVGVYTALAALNWLYLGAALVRWYREVRTMGRGVGGAT
ncbi:CDP-alcohol phosphatidyltransferase [Beutenbergia cavernae DSM 12333]|uniref:CDP-alcohol phosphatidyltransferase n=1 Tax=Beutenbergia cavernae (strain ATCC BAA-8 / DSM 12333 / CCUG 43141 / JCM 11478 / NBRC 16432 / NCIMB 13614 / HKI 0122) TaxID=471853 RepID=C5C069_BEUC1|nr:CDP-alcohol phosphatidyltransferase family protein [Beutenbergia cavernae]ACQ79255.1 CDP-alcohol phosphatidyltransferase [Beutenbergia cavernae DSM 12333]